MNRIELPLEKAILRAAEQNFLRDVKLHLMRASEWQDQEQRELYLAEAREVLTTTGENYLPEFGEPLIAVADFDKE